MKKRVFSFAMALVMLFSMLPVNALAQTGDAVPDYHPEGATIWLPEGEEPSLEEYPVDAEKGYQWIETGSTDPQLVCGVESHGHTYNCGENCQLVHAHDDDCYGKTFTCGIVEHEHDGSCYTTSYSCGLTENPGHSHEDSCYQYERTCDLEESEGHIHGECKVENKICGMDEGDGAHAHGDGCYDAEGTLTCTTEESKGHQHVESCYNITYTCGLEEGAGAHEHVDSCYTKTETLICGKNEGDGAHTHDDTCNPTSTQSCTTTPHSHNVDTCTWQKNDTLVCDKDDTHVCVTNGCTQDCTDAHHTDACYTQMAQWGVANYGLMTTDEGQGLPICFFIAEPGEAIDPNGNYVDFKEALWGKNDGTTGFAYAKAGVGVSESDPIHTQLGIRNANSETTITDNVYSWPNNDPEGFKKFDTMTFTNRWGLETGTYKYDDGWRIQWVTICWRDDTYDWPDWRNCGCGSNYDHIHIDGVLTKPVEIDPTPDTEAESVKLTKIISETRSTDQEFTFTLRRLMQDAEFNPTSNINQSFNPIKLTANVAAGQTSAPIMAEDGVTIDFGYYVLTEDSHMNWEFNPANSTYSENAVYIYIAPDGTVQYSGSPTNGYSSSKDGVTIANKVREHTVSYKWIGMSNTVKAPLPPTVTVKDQQTHAINDTYTVGEVIYDMDNGVAYTFEGWLYWTDEDDTEYQNIGNATNLTITSDTVIYGQWIPKSLPETNATLTLRKEYQGNDSLLPEGNHYIRVENPTTRISIVDAVVKDFTKVDQGGKTYYEYTIPIAEGTYTVSENLYDIKGYTWVDPDATAEAKSSVAATAVAHSITDDDGNTSNKTFMTAKSPTYDATINSPTVTITVKDLPHYIPTYDEQGNIAGTPPVYNVGTVEFVNVYTKNMNAEDLHVYPDVTFVKVDSEDTAKVLPGAEFKLYKYDETATTTDTYVPVDDITYTTDENGRITITQLSEGNYKLVETVAPAGYVLNTNNFHFTVAEDANQKEENYYDSVQNAYVTRHQYIVTHGQNVTVNTDGSLQITNAPIKGSLAITKTFSDVVTDDDKAYARIIAHLHGPITEVNGVIHGMENVIRVEVDDVQAGNLVATENNIPLGKYLVHEAFASLHGYSWKNVEYPGAETIPYNNETYAVIDITATNHTHALTIKNTYTAWEEADFYIKKVEAGTNTILPGATFKLYDDANHTVDVTDRFYQGVLSDGRIHFDHFKAGPGTGEHDGEPEVKEENGQEIYTYSKDYYLVESAAPTNYAKSNYIWRITVKATVKDENTTEYDIRVEENRNDGNGWVTASDTSIGTFDRTSDTLTVENAPVLGSLTINKVFASNSDLKAMQAENDGGVAGVTVNVRSADGTVNKDISLSWNDTVKAWEETIDNLRMGTYYITETHAERDGYDLSVQYQVDGHTYTTGQAVLVPSATQENVTIVNRYTKKVAEKVVRPGSLTVTKLAEGGGYLTGAEFTLYTDAACTKVYDYAETEGVIDGVVTTAGELGEATFHNLFGDENSLLTDRQAKTTYYLKETNAPAGYVACDTVWTVQLSADQKTLLLNELNQDKFFQTVIDWITGVFGGNDPSHTNETGKWYYDNGMLVVYNAEAASTLTVNKKVAYQIEGSPVDNPSTIAHLKTLTDKDGNNFIRDSYAFQVTITDNDNSSRENTFNLAENGTHSLTVHTNDGFTVVESVGENPYFTTSYAITGDSNNGNVIDAGDTPVVTVTNTYTFSKYDEHDHQNPNPDNMRACLILNKVDNTDTAVSGAEFTLYKEDKQTVIDTDTTSTEDSEADGIIHLHITEPGTYYLKETVVPDGYKASEEYIKIVATKGYEARTVLDSEGNTHQLINKKLTLKYDIDDKKIVNIPTPGVMIFTKSFAVKNKNDAYAPTNADNMQVNHTVKFPIHVRGPVEYSEPVGGNSITEVTNWGDSYETELIYGNDGKWTATLTGLPVGKYLIHEAFASVHGYNWDSAVFHQNSISLPTVKAEHPTEHTEITFAVVDVPAPENGAANSTVALTVQNNYTAWTAADFYVHKYDTLSNQPIANVTFTLHTAENCTSCSSCKTVATDAAGHAHFSDLTAGASGNYYYLKETTPMGYVDNDTVYRILVKDTNNVFDLTMEKKVGNDQWQTVPDTDFNSTTDELRIGNKPKTGTLTISKVFGDDSDLKGKDQDSENGIETIQVKVTSDNGYDEIVVLGKQDNDSYVWSKELTKLRLGTYTVTEINADRAYHTLATEYTGVTANNQFTVDANGDHHTVRITNTYAKNRFDDIDPAELTILKVDKANNQPLDGAEFTLYTDANFNKVFDITGTEAIEGKVTTVNGRAVITGLAGEWTPYDKPSNNTAAKTYYLKETKAPAGYVLPETYWTVAVDWYTQTLKIEERNDFANTFDTIIDWIISAVTGNQGSGAKADYSYDNNQLTVKNAALQTTLTVEKQVKYELDGVPTDASQIATLIDMADKAGIILDSYKFNVSIANEPVVNDALNVMKHGDTVELPIRYGETYTVAEQTTGNFTTAITPNASGTIGLNDNGSPVAQSVTVTNTYHFYEVDEHDTDPTPNGDDLRSCLTFKKMDGAQPLPGAEFTLYKSDGKTVVSQTEAITTSGANGQLHFHVTEPGTYILKETGTPDGYETCKPITIQVKEKVEAINGKLLVKLETTIGGETFSNYEIQNRHKPIDISVSKIWNDDNYYKRPDSVKVDLIRNEGNSSTIVDTVTLKKSNNWSYTWEDLDYYTKWDVIEHGIEGYSSVDYDSTTDNEGNQEIVIENVRVPQPIEVSVKKIWRGGTAPSVTIRLYENGLYVDKVTLSEKNDWYHEWTQLNGEPLMDSQEYTIKEDRVSGFYAKITNEGNDWVVTNTVSVIPETGDYIMIAVGVLAVSGVALAVLFLLKKRKK